MGRAFSLISCILLAGWDLLLVSLLCVSVLSLRLNRAGLLCMALKFYEFLPELLMSLVPATLKVPAGGALKDESFLDSSRIRAWVSLSLTTGGYRDRISNESSR